MYANFSNSSRAVYFAKRPLVGLITPCWSVYQSLSHLRPTAADWPTSFYNQLITVEFVLPPCCHTQTLIGVMYLLIYYIKLNRVRPINSPFAVH